MVGVGRWSRIEIVISISFALIYVGLAFFIAIVGGVHGPQVFPYFVLGYLCATESALAWLHFSLRRRAYKSKTLLLLAGAVALAISLVAGSFATWRPLVNSEVARMERQAAATRVFNVHDQTLLSEKGNPIGIRLRYSMRFPTSDYFWQSPRLAPQTDLAVGIWADGRISHQEVDPPMALGNSGVQRYEKEKTYNFTAEFVPNFLIWNAEKTKLCIVNPPVEYKANFESLVANSSGVRYKIDISGTTYEGSTEKIYEPRSFYESAKKEGAAQLEGQGFGGSTTPCK